MENIMSAVELRKPQHTYYIGLGALDIFYTFRKEIIDKYGLMVNDTHICNLSTNLEEAQRKAEQYVQQIKDRLGDAVDIAFEKEVEHTNWVKPKYKVSAFVLMRLEAIENGVVPFGKHEGTKIVDLPDDYILWMADKNPTIGDDNDSLPFKMLSDMCLGMCLERGLFEQRKQDNDKLKHYGEVGQRKVMTGIVKSAYQRRTGDYGGMGHRDYGIQYSYTLEIEGCNVRYQGSVDLGIAGDTVTMKATIAEHKVDSETKRKTTIIKRPSAVEIIKGPDKE